MRLSVKAKAAVLATGINPLAAIIPLIDPGEDVAKGNGCASLAERARHALPAAGGRK